MTQICGIFNNKILLSSSRGQQTSLVSAFNVWESMTPHWPTTHKGKKSWISTSIETKENS